MDIVYVHKWRERIVSAVRRISDATSRQDSILDCYQMPLRPQGRILTARSRRQMPGMRPHYGRPIRRRIIPPGRHEGSCRVVGPWGLWFGGLVAGKVAERTHEGFSIN